MPCDKVCLELTLVVFVERAADDLLDLAVVQVDARSERRFATGRGHGGHEQALLQVDV